MQSRLADLIVVYGTLHLTTARENPGEITMPSVGPATTQHIGFEQLKLDAKVTMTYVPFPGGAPAVNARLGDPVKGFPGYGVEAWLGMVVPAGTSRPQSANSTHGSWPP